MAKTSKSTNDDAPWSCCLAHDTDQEVPQFLQSWPSDGKHSALTAEWHVDVDARRFQQFTPWVRARRKQPALVCAQAVRAEQDIWQIYRVQKRRADTAWRCQHERRAVTSSTATTVTTSGHTHLLCRRCWTEASQRATGERHRQRPTTTGVDGKTQVFEELRPAAEWNEVGDCLLRYNLRPERNTHVIKECSFNICNNNDLILASYHKWLFYV